MIKVCASLFCILLFSGCNGSITESSQTVENPATAGANDVDSEIRRAQEAIGIFAAALQAELKTAMQKGGPLNAVTICNHNALPISTRVSAEQGLQLSRVSLRNRNPANAPLDWQVPVLESFDQQQAKGNDPKTLSWSEVTEESGARQFRYMKAIPTASICLQCHGNNLAPDLNARIKELYPQDKATGFMEGDIRGAFVVTRTIID